MRLLAFLTFTLLLLQPASFAKSRSVQIIVKHTVIIGDTVNLRVTGLPPNNPITISAELIDRAGRIWRSSANFISTGRGEVDLSKQAPLASSYSGIDPLGLFWSMQDSKEVSSDRSMFDTDQVSTVTFRVTHEGKSLAETRHKRWRQAPALTFARGVQPRASLREA